MPKNQTQSPIDPYDNALSGYTFGTEAWVDNVKIEDVNRTAQQNIIPTAIKPRLLEGLFARSNLSWSTFLVSNSTSAIVKSTLTNTAGNFVVAIPDIAVYFGINDITQINESYQWPNSTLAANLPVYINISDYGRSNGTNQVATTLIRNNSGGALQILYACQWRLLVEPGTTAGT